MADGASDREQAVVPPAEQAVDRGDEKPLVERISGGGSPIRQYQEIFVGSRSWLALLRYELVFGLVAHIPGALGYGLRKMLFPGLFASVGRGALFGRGMTVRCPARMTFGERVVLDDGVVLDAKGGDTATIVLGSNIWIGRGCIIASTDARLRMGDDISIGAFCNIHSRGFIEIGSQVAIGSGCSILAGSHDDSDPSVPMLERKRTALGIRIGDNVWLGTGACILDGVSVGSGAVVGAGAVVSQDVPPMSVVVGNPARVVRKREPAES
jgi:acetyltransferase-like isoleucine patch superfamily enzyme